MAARNLVQTARRYKAGNRPKPSQVLDPSDADAIGIGGLRVLESHHTLPPFRNLSGGCGEITSAHSSSSCGARWASSWAPHCMPPCQTPITGNGSDDSGKIRAINAGPMSKRTLQRERLSTGFHGLGPRHSVALMVMK